MIIMNSMEHFENDLFDPCLVPQVPPFDVRWLEQKLLAKKFLAGKLLAKKLLAGKLLAKKLLQKQFQDLPNQYLNE
jgi:hypothetical protein